MDTKMKETKQEKQERLKQEAKIKKEAQLLFMAATKRALSARVR